MSENRSTVTVVSGLTLLPIRHITGFDRDGMAVRIEARVMEEDTRAMPGTAKVQASKGDGVFKKQIDYDCIAPQQSQLTRLEELKAEWLVALYTDPRGERRVCGSPAYPLTLDFEESGGKLKVSLSGTDTKPDGYVQARAGAV